MLVRAAFNCFVATVIFLYSLTINLLPVVSQCKFCCWYKLIVPLLFVLGAEGKIIPVPLACSKSLSARVGESKCSGIKS